MPISLTEQTPVASRQHWLSVVARADAERLEGVLDSLGTAPAYEMLRQPETGVVMVQGRAGGTGRPFNLGDMTVTRCNVRMADGTVGAAYVAGRCHRHAELAAVIDAVLQTTESDCPLRDAIESLSREQQERRAQQGRKAAATKVEFFTMVRGED